MKESQLSDEQIIRAILAGERDLYRELLRRYRTLVFSSILRQTGSRQIAEDLAQETFVKAYTALGGFRFESRFSTWIVRIALNTTSSYFASRAYRELKQTTPFDVAGHDRSAELSLEEAREGRAKLERFRLELSRLPARLREVLVLCGIEGRSYEEAAEIVGIPIGTIRSRLNKARLTIQKALEDSPEKGGTPR